MPNATHDTEGRPYAKLSEMKAGVELECDAGFDCIKPGSRRRVLAASWKEDKGRLYIRCKSGCHFLDGQADDGEHLIGLYVV